MSVRSETLRRLVRDYHRALDALRYELHRSRGFQIQARRRVDRAWSALYAVAGKDWMREARPVLEAELERKRRRSSG